MDTTRGIPTPIASEQSKWFYQGTWSPDASRVFCVMRESDNRNYLVLVSAGTGQVRKLFPEQGEALSGANDWSADGKYVYFDTGFSKDLAVYRVNVADRKVERVASLQNFRRVVNPWVSWMGLTPDGSPLLMHDIGTQEVYALDFETP